MPPIGTPSWCLNENALERFNRSNINIPVYDYNTDSAQDESDNDIEHESSGEETTNKINRTNPSKKKKRKSKKKSIQKKNKKHKSK